VHFVLDFGKTGAKNEGMEDGKASTAWKPSALQLEVLKVFQGHDYGVTVVAACGEAKIDRGTYYDWHDKPEFRQWWESQSDRFFALQLNRVQAATLAAATGKDCTGCADRKLFYERFDKDYCPQSKSKQEHSGAVDVALNMANMDAAELERLAHATNDPAAVPGLPDTPDGGDPPAGPVGTVAP